jgi:PleD family two-component response regulator
LPITVSAGVAERGARLATPEDVLRAADDALYRAKHAGRNRVAT